MRESLYTAHSARSGTVNFVYAEVLMQWSSIHNLVTWLKDDSSRRLIIESCDSGLWFAKLTETKYVTVKRKLYHVAVTQDTIEECLLALDSHVRKHGPA